MLADGVTKDDLSAPPKKSLDSIRLLKSLPALRKLGWRKDERDQPIRKDLKNPQAESAAVLQTCGKEAPRPCTSCMKGRGPWKTCVVFDGNRRQFPSCANCRFSRLGCSFGESKAPMNVSVCDLFKANPWPQHRKIRRYGKHRRVCRAALTLRNLSRAPRVLSFRIAIPLGPFAPETIIGIPRTRTRATPCPTPSPWRSRRSHQRRKSARHARHPIQIIARTLLNA